MAAKTWSRTVGDANWSTGANWNGGTVPATTDVVTFDGTSVLACTVDALGTFTGQIIVAAGYTGGTATITQNVAIPSTAAFSIAGGTWVQAAAITRTTFAVTGGTFTGGSQSITLSGTLTFSGGSLTMTSGTCTISTGSFTQTNTPTFNANGGTIAFTGGTAATLTGPNCTFNKITFTKTNIGFTVASGTTCPLGTGPTNSCGTGTFLVNGTVTWTNTFTLTGVMDTASTTTITVSGTPRLSINLSLTFHASATITGSMPVDFIGSATAAVTATAYTFGTCTISRTGQFTVAASTTIPLGSSPTTTSDNGSGLNALIITGTVTVSGTWTHTGSITVSATTGTVSGSLTAVSISGSVTINTTATFPATIPFTFSGAGIGVITATAYTFGTCVLNKTTGGLTVAASTTVPFGASPTLTSNGGTLTVTGTATASGTITTSADLSITISSGGSFSGGFTTINLSGSLNINAAASTLLNGVILNCLLGVTCTITATASAFGTCTINRTGGTGQLTVAASTTLPLGANPSVVSSGGIIISGTLDGSGTLSVNQTSGSSIGFSIGSAGDISDFTALNMTDTNTLTFNATCTIAAGLNITVTRSTTETLTFAGNGKTFGFLKLLGPGSNVQITGGNTFTYIQDNDAASVSHELSFSASTTTTLTDVQPFRVAGHGAVVITVNSTTSTNAVLTATNANAYISCRLLFVDDVTVDAAPVWYAGADSTSSGDAPNWVFTNNPRDAKYGKQNFRVMT